MVPRIHPDGPSLASRERVRRHRGLGSDSGFVAPQDHDRSMTQTQPGSFSTCSWRSCDAGETFVSSRSVARNSAKAARYYIRNEAVVGLLHFPFPFSILRWINCLRILRNPKWNVNWGSLLWGWVEAFPVALSWWNLRRPLSLTQFRAWKSLPLPKQ